MDWVTLLLAAGLVLGVAAGTALVVRNPAWWVGLGHAVVKAVTPAIVAYLIKRNPPEVEKAMQDCIRRGGRWNNFKKRCE